MFQRTVESVRLDQYLVLHNLTNTRGQAKALIEKGDVIVNGIAQTKTSFKVKEDDQIELTSTMYVSRGAFKLVKAIDYYKLSVEGLIAVDVGASTGGFTEVLLENKVQKVYCVDVGHGQLSSKIKDNPKIINLEKTNARNPLPIEEQVDLFVCDVSFISLKLIFKNMADILKTGGKGIILIKPQFEAGRERIQKNGLVAPLIRLEVLEEIKQWFHDNNYNVSDIIESPIKGNKSKNIEYLGLYTKD